MGDEGDLYSMESFEPFVSDADSMLILGAPIDFEGNVEEDVDFFNEDRATKIPSDNRHRIQSGSDTDESSRSAMQSSRVKFREQRESNTASSSQGLPFDIASFGFLGEDDVDEEDNTHKATIATSTRRHIKTPVARLGHSQSDGESSNDGDDQTDRGGDYEHQLHHSIEKVELETVDELSSAPKPKKLRKKRKKKKVQPAPEAGPETQSTTKHSQPVPPSIDKKPGSSNATGKRVQYVAPKPNVKGSMYADAPNDGEFRRVPILQYAPKKPVLHVPPITSNIEREVKPTQGYNLQKQYDIALKQIQAYSKEREILLARLDESAIELEIEKLRAQLLEKDAHIQLLLEDNRSLKKQCRHQSDYLASIGREKGDDDDEAKTLATYVLVLEERVRRLKVQLESTQKRDRLTTAENEKLLKKLEKVTATKDKQRKQILSLKEKYVYLESMVSGMQSMGSMPGSFDTGSIGDMDTVSLSNDGPGEELANLLPQFNAVQQRTSAESSHSKATGHKSPRSDLVPVSTNTTGLGHLGSTAVEHPSVASASGVGHSDQADRDDDDSLSTTTAKTGTTAGHKSKAYGIYTSHADMVKKLQRSLDLQRESFIRQLTNVQAELKHTQIENTDLKQKLFNLEATSRAQKFAVRQLRDAYDSLADSQKRLHTTSNDYFAQEKRNISSAPASGQGQQIPASPKPPSGTKPNTTGNPVRRRGGHGPLQGTEVDPISQPEGSGHHNATFEAQANHSSQNESAPINVRIGSTLEEDHGPKVSSRLERLAQPRHVHTPHSNHDHHSESNISSSHGHHTRSGNQIFITADVH